MQAPKIFLKFTIIKWFTGIALMCIYALRLHVSHCRKWQDDNHNLTEPNLWKDTQQDLDRRIIRVDFV